MKTPERSWPPQIETRCGDSAESVAMALADEVAERLSRALSEQGQASLAVSGGSTPIGFFKALSKAELDWSRVTITLADERWLDTQSERSNERVVRQHLLQGAVSRARFISLKQPHDSANAGQPLTEKALGELTWPLAVLVLGMGNDGHTASLFPDAPELSTAMDVGQSARSIAMHPASQPEPRISLTRQALAESRWTALHLRGEDKLETLDRAVSDLADTHKMPIRAFLADGLTLYWSP
jgi:6-phosphogluconolactonase